MIYGSVCSGIEAATVAWHPLGWEPAWFSEIDAFPRAVLEHHYPNVRLYGDFTTIKDPGRIDLLVGGTPCQAFSVAGLRRGLDDARGNLTLEFLRLADRCKPRWIVWENVPGVLSIDGGRTFGTFLGALAELGYGFAYRVLDAQYFGVPQRRRRVFVVGCLGDWRAAAAVLFERHSLQGHPAPSREAGKGLTHSVASSLTSSGRGVERGEDSRGQDPVVAMCLNAKGGMGRIDAESETFIATGQGYWSKSPVAATLGTEARSLYESTVANQTTGFKTGVCSVGMAVRRLTPREAERLQGFPDDYTAVPYRGKPAADGPRYKSLGNSMAVPVMRWIGERIQQVDTLLSLDQTEQPQPSPAMRQPSQANDALLNVPTESETHAG